MTRLYTKEEVFGDNLIKNNIVSIDDRIKKDELMKTNEGKMFYNRVYMAIFESKFEKDEDINSIIASESAMNKLTNDNKTIYNAAATTFPEDIKYLSNSINFARLGQAAAILLVIDLLKKKHDKINYQLEDIILNALIRQDNMVKHAKRIRIGLIVLILFLIIFALFVFVLVYVLIIILTAKKIKLPWRYKAFGWVPFYNIGIAVNLIKLLRQTG